MSMKESILNGIAKDCYNMGASIGAEKDLILVNYLDFDKEATLSPFNRQLNDDFGNKGGLTDIILKEGAETYTFEGTDYSVVPSVTTEIKENGNAWYSHSIAFTVYNKSSYARETLLMLGKARVVAITRDRSTGLFEVFGAEQGLKMSGLDRAYTGAQNSNFYTVTIATPDIAIIREKSLGELSLKLNGESGGGGTIPPDDNNLEYLLSLKEDKANKGVANGYTPLGADVKVPASYLNIVNDLTTGGVTALLSAEQGKIIGDRIDTGLDNLRIERLITIEEPITRENASEAINNLPAFEVLDNEIPYFVTTNVEAEAGYRVDLVGLGKGFYGVGGTAIGASQVRITGLIDNGALGLNQILGLGNTGVNKSIIMTDSTNPNLVSTWSQNGLQVKDGNNLSFLANNTFRFTNTTTFGNSVITPPTRTSVTDSSNALPNVSGTLAVSVNGVFADANGNIELSSGGGIIPSWQQTLNVASADVLVPLMKVSNNMSESYFALNDTSNAVAFQVTTPKRVLFDAGLNGRVELGNGLGVLIDGKNKKVEIKADNAEGMLLDAGATGGISFVQNTGITLDARTQGLTLLGQTKGININSGLSLTIGGGLMTVNSLSQFNQKVTLKNTTGLTLNTNTGNFESSIKSDNVTKAGLIFQLPNPTAGTYTLATTADIVAPTLNAVLTTGSIGTDKTITLNSLSNVNAISTSTYNQFRITDIVSGETRRATVTANSFLYENTTGNLAHKIDSFGIESKNTSTNIYTQITPNGLLLMQNPTVSTYYFNLKGTNIAGSTKTIELPNVSGTLTATVNGYAPDSNGNIILPIAGEQDLNSILTIGNSAGGLSIQDLNDLELVTGTFNNSTAITVLKQKTGSVISGNLILPEKTGDNTLALSVNNVVPNSAGLITLPITNFADGENLNVTVVPPTSHYTPTTSTLKGHLQGIDQALGAVVQTTAGITNRIYFTGVVTNVSGTDYYSSLANNKGAVSTVTQTVNNDDNAKSYFAQDVISASQTVVTTVPAGTFAGQLTVSVNNDNAQERFTVEVYKTNTAGTPIASGVTGAPVGSLGVTVVAILDSGIIDLVANTNSNVSVTGALASSLTINVGERLRYHVSAEKVGTAGAVFTYSLFYGSNHNSYYDIPVIATTDTVNNRSLVTGVTTSDALNFLSASIATLTTNLSTETTNRINADASLGVRIDTNDTLIANNQNAISSLQTLKEDKSNKATNFSVVNNTLYPTVQAVKAYADGLVVGLLDDRGSYNASSNIFPTTGGSGDSGAILKGDIWYVSVAGTLGGKAVNVGDSFRALVDSPAQVAGNWALLSSNLSYVPANDANVVHIAGTENITGLKNFTSASTALTASLGTNTTQIATTAFVIANSNRLISHLEFDDTAKTVWNNGFSNSATNTSFGDRALDATTVTSNSFNSAFGYEALTSLTTGTNNTALGYRALATLVGQFENTAVGSFALANATSFGNSALGNNALGATTSGGSNVGFGSQALSQNTTGANNVGIGTGAGRYIADGTTNNTLLSGSVLIGAQTKVLATGQTNQIVIGYDATGLGSNTVVLGNTSILTTRLRGAVQGGSFVKDGGTASEALMADGSVLTNPVSGTGIINRISKWSSTGAQSNSLLLDQGTDIVYQLATYGASAVGEESKFIFNSSGTNGAGIGARKITTNTADLIMYAQFGFNNSTEMARFKSNGRFGVGVDPIALLHVQETNGGLFFDGENGTYNRFKSTGSTSTTGKDLLISTQTSGVTPDIYVKNNGKVGIGTSTGVGSLDINTGLTGINGDIASMANGSISFGNGSVSSAVPTMYSKTNSNASGFLLISGAIDGNTNPDMQFNVRRNDNLDFSVFTTSAFRFGRFGAILMDIRRDGNVNIGSGVVASDAKLNVQTEITTTYTSSLTTPSVNFMRLSNVHNSGGADQYATLSLQATGNNGVNNAYAGLSVIQPVAGSSNSEFAITVRQNSGAMNEVMRALSNGNIGIGTTTPTSPLDVFGAQNSRIANFSTNLTPDSGVTMSQGLAILQVNVPSAGAGYALGGYNVNSTSSTAIVSQVATTADSGTVPLIMLEANTLNNAGSGAGSVSTRPILGISNYTNKLVTVLASGAIGIGTATPNYNLNIHTNSVSSFMQLTSTTTGSTALDGLIMGTDLNGASLFINRENTHMAFYTNNGEKVRVHASGAVSIGNTVDKGAGNLNVTGKVTASPATASDELVTKAQLDAVATASGTSGTYTPTIGGFSNVSAMNPTTATYIKVGNIVMVTVGFSGTTTTTNTTSAFTITLPFNRPSSTGIQCGSGSANNSAFATMTLNSSSTTTVQVLFNSGAGTGTWNGSATFQYSV